MTAPRATYRLQLRPGFGFREAGEVADYLGRLGVSHLYSSPQSQAAPGSEHGYDVADPTRLSDDLGGPGAHAAMRAELSRHGLGLVLDIVPNHMAVATPENRWWWDILRFGRASPWSEFFDIEWDAPHAGGRLLLPVLGDKPSAVLERGELRLQRAGAEVHLVYFEHVVPIGPGSVAALLRQASDGLGRVADQQEAMARAQTVAPEERDAADAASARALAEPGAAEAFERALREAEAPDRLADLLQQQAYRLAFWRDGAAARNYRRFFDIDQLAAIRVEDPRVFDATHALPLAAIAEAAADGLRIDHPDGLRDPVGYLQRLRERAPDAWIVIEKILEPGERARGAWPVDGLTGYEFIDTVSHLLVDPAGAEPLNDAWGAFAGEIPAWPALVHDCKRLAARSMFGPELDRLSRLLGRAAAGEDAQQREAIEEIACWLHIYRTYLRPGHPPKREDIERITEACALSRAGRPDLAASIDQAQDAMLGGLEVPAAAEFTLRFQQLSGTLMAKGVEDCAFYRYLRLVALNEVGGDPSRFGISLDEFHARMRRRQQDWPDSMLATSTHDTKRSEDVRARLLALSEIPGVWRDTTHGWRAAAELLRREAPIDPHDEYLLYQTLVGAWPSDRARITDYMRKAAREAKRRTSWIEPDAAYEQALTGFIERLFADADLIAAIGAMAARLTPAGRINSLAQTLLKLTAPGACDIYQGCDLWDLSLVDPDNRRPVDFDLRRSMLAECERLSPPAIWGRMDEGLPKLWTIRQALQLRQRRPDLLGGAAGYEPLRAQGEQADCCIAFTRAGGLAVIASRFPVRLESGWGETTLALPDGRWNDLLGGRKIPGGETRLGELLAIAPIALLERE